MPEKQHRFQVYGSTFRVDAHYEYVRSLGKGSYGIVCSAKDKRKGEQVAIKKITPLAQRTSDAKHVLREIRLMRHLGSHPNVVTLKDLIINPNEDELYVVMDLMDTDLHQIIQSSQPLTDAHFKYFLHQLLRGVKYMHAHRILHRDLKPGNLLVTKACTLKIADFGLARKVPDSKSINRPRSASNKRRAPMTEHVVTRWYRPPELMLQPDGYYGGAVDMWSVGCILAEMLGRKPIFPGKNFVHQLSLIFEVIGTPVTTEISKIKSSQAQKFLRSLPRHAPVPFQKLFPRASADAIDLLQHLLEFDPRKRYTAEQALAHPYLRALEKRYKKADPDTPDDISFEFENEVLSRSQLKKLIIAEASDYNLSKSSPIEAQPQIASVEKKQRPLSAGSGIKRANSATEAVREKLSRPKSAAPMRGYPGQEGIKDKRVGAESDLATEDSSANTPQEKVSKVKAIAPTRGFPGQKPSEDNPTRHVVRQDGTQYRAKSTTDSGVTSATLRTGFYRSVDSGATPNSRVEAIASKEQETTTRSASPAISTPVASETATREDGDLAPVARESTLAQNEHCGVIQEEKVGRPEISDEGQQNNRESEPVVAKEPQKIGLVQSKRNLMPSQQASSLHRSQSSEDVISKLEQINRSISTSILHEKKFEEKSTSSIAGSAYSLIRKNRDESRSGSSGNQLNNDDVAMDKVGSNVKPAMKPAGALPGDKRAVGKPQRSKKLTVPMSPKFSVMSWQKKRPPRQRSNNTAFDPTATAARKRLNKIPLRRF